jgi:hypothetical protein
MGEHAVLHPGDEHDLELQALGVVEGHQGHRGRGLVVLVLLGDQGDQLQELGETGVGEPGLELGAHPDQLPEVLLPGLRLHGALRVPPGEC